MTVYELNRDQLIELKRNYYTQEYNDHPSYGELADIDNLVSDQEIYDAYDGTDFVPDDFSSSAGEDEEDWRWVKLDIDGEFHGTRNGIADDLCQIAEWIRQGNFGGFFYKGVSWKIEQ